MKRARIAGLLTAVLIVLIGGIVLLSAHAIGPLNIPKLGERWIPLINLTASITSAMLMTQLLIIGFDDHFNRRVISSLFKPILLLHTTIAYALGIQGIAAADRLLHGGTLEWTILFDTEVRLIIAGIYILLVAALAWQMYEIQWGIKRT